LHKEKQAHKKFPAANDAQTAKWLILITFCNGVTNPVNVLFVDCQHHQGDILNPIAANDNGVTTDRIHNLQIKSFLSFGENVGSKFIALWKLNCGLLAIPVDDNTLPG
jgi:hypothetical protein